MLSPWPLHHILHRCAVRWAAHPTADAQAAQEPHSRPDFGVVYAFLGSLFDERLKSQQLVDHEQLLRDLGPSDRATLHQLLQSLTHGLSRPNTVHRFAQVSSGRAATVCCGKRAALCAAAGPACLVLSLRKAGHSPALLCLEL